MRYVKFWLLVLFASFALAGQAAASSSFQGSAQLSFSLSGDLTDILVQTSGAFIDDGSSALFGDATFVPEYRFNSLSDAGFAVVANVNDSAGEVVVLRHLADFKVVFTNSGTQQQSFSLLLNYALSGVVSGEFADAGVQLAYDNSGFDEIYVSLGYQSLNQLQGSSSRLFTLAPGQQAEFSVQVATNASLLGTTPVPVPSAFWLFISAMSCLIGVRGRAKV